MKSDTNDRGVWILGRIEKEKDKKQRRIRTGEKGEGRRERRERPLGQNLFVAIHQHAIVFLRLQRIFCQHNI